jgi:2-polyprenyl-3-methyl-5-hydroxy-6-metoxy-1,4-benzoquinol methylase
VKERPCLDVGCGDGLITSLLGPRTTGIDDCALAVELAQKHKVNASVGSVYDLGDSVKYEAIFLGDVIEHLEHPGAALVAIRKALSDGGFLYISTPPKQPILSPYHHREYTPEELVMFVSAHGFELVGELIVRPEWLEMYGKFRKT